ncbi:gliding motility-associated peptidyl-prolyl isomerase GldI [Flavobacteriaceae bacterium F89]|uniref:Peptidyl-prolyl cis-trans isomerase n=1 Tax=Cerina litoralis TaxID=2874477 RepID=A0AAE3ET97_9FLAO|nr:gliding motility-associated peptidyl-prolyl isomerase GldI [Cerina litoralis]MCG2460752.1 gliding motility-associated peptidyl-prolyl isomerase GldI [Cerina litoralis]
MKSVNYSLFILIFIGVISCGEPEPRRPIKVGTGSFMKESVERNKILLAEEEEVIKQIMEQDTSHTYHSSASGSWFYYDVQNEDATYYPRSNDLVTFTYNIVSFDNDTIYSKNNLGIQKYKVDKQELFPGLRNSIKLLKENETATFLFPSSIAYGYHGDDNKIGHNIPIKSTISILKIERPKDSIQK